MGRGTWETTAVWWNHAMLWRAKPTLLFRTVPCNSTVNELRSGESIRFKTHDLFFVLDRSRSGFHSTVQLDTLLQEDVHPFPNTVAHTYKIHVQHASGRLCNEEPITITAVVCDFSRKSKETTRNYSRPIRRHGAIVGGAASTLYYEYQGYMDTAKRLSNEDAVCK